MTTENKYKSDLSEALHSSAVMLRKVGVMDQATMEDFDSRHLACPVSFEPEQIKALREANKVSRSDFAKYLNISPSAVEKWESGSKRPSGMALKLLSLVQKHGLHILA